MIWDLVAAFTVGIITGLAWAILLYDGKLREARTQRLDFSREAAAYQRESDRLHALLAEAERKNTVAARHWGAHGR